ncbi:MAG: hypothetical protein IT348_01850 [Candidatus Eisenbacteria bacterium]|nr:hypothetical protein [Candidatus Eisenbacteria bacterium]
MAKRPTTRRGMTLIEIILVMGMLVLIAGIAVPRLMSQLQGRQLELSSRQMAAVISLVRANAQFDGKRYRIRFANEDERDEISDPDQPIIEREDDPMEEPGRFNPVLASWVRGETLMGRVWCAEVRLGKPSIEELRTMRESRGSEIEKEQIRAFEDFDPDRPPLVIEPDGSCEWATFVFTEAPRDYDLQQLEEEVRLELILDGFTGQSWLQRPFYDEEIDLFEEKHWPAVLRQDLLTSAVLTEDDVLEIHERRMLQGQEDSVRRTDEVDEEDLDVPLSADGV